MKKLFIFLLSIILCMQSQISLSYATDTCPYHQISSEISLVPGPKVTLNGEINDTYWVFERNSDAFNKINIIESEIISNLASIYGLSSLSMETWYDYQTALDSYYQDDNISFDQYQDSKLRIFLEVCDNIERNNRIIQLYNKENFDEEDKEEMAMLLPYFSPYYKDYAEKNANNKSSRASLNLTNMINYAETWSINYNPGFRKQSSDCTNYVSQIARAGNAKDTPTTSDTINSWWWKSYDEYSISWVRADWFVKHFGVAYSYTSFYDFSMKAYKGAFIALDSELDGKWNHCAFVTAVGTVANYGGKTYRDLKISQHTKNYHAWVSSATNDWENAGGIKAVLNAPAAK